jgi:dihydrolipoamide dehydrogenase
MRYDVCVIGGGPSGYAAAMRGLDFGLKVLMIERDKIGGAGLYNGALSSKTLWEISKDVDHAVKHTNKYSTVKEFKLDYNKVREEVGKAVYERKTQLETHLYMLQREGYKDLFFLKYGDAELITKNQIKITAQDGTFEYVETDNIIIATGSRPNKLPNLPIDENIVVTSDGVHDWEQLPESMVVLGAGVIGCEYATIFSNFGKTKVYIIDKADHILPFEDLDIVQKVEQSLMENGVVIHRNSRLVRMDIVNGLVEYELQYKDGTTDVFQVEKALVAVGRLPNTEGLGLENVGVLLNERGAIIDNDTQTNISNIYAVGDVTADIALVNVGELEGRHAIKKIVNKVSYALSYDNISSIMFLKPIVASVGMNEKQARSKGISYQVVTIDYSCIPRAIAMRNPKGFFKILVTNDKDMKVLGMRAMGPHASSAIQAVALLISTNKGIEELSEMIYPHPSLIEGIQEAARVLLGKPIFKPHVFKHGIKYHGYMNSDFETKPK